MQASVVGWNSYCTSFQYPPDRGENRRFGRYQRVIRGGSFQDEFISVRLSNRGYELGPNPAAAAGSVEIAGKSSVKIGFRCAADQ